MWSNISLSSFLDRVTLLERPLDRAREFFHGSIPSPPGTVINSIPSPITNNPAVIDESSDNDTALTGEASSCDFDLLEPDDEHKNGWVSPQETTVRLVTSMYSKLWNEHSVDLGRLEVTLSNCPPRENLLLVEDKDHYNLLHKAIILNSIPMMQILLSHGCNVNWANRKSCMHSRKCNHANIGVLHLACYLGRKDMTEILLRWGADKTARRRVFASVALSCPDNLQPDSLVSCKTSEKEEILITCGAREPVFFAVLGDQVEVVKLFIRDDSSYHYVEETHLLHLACRIGAWRCLEYFIQVCPNAVNTVDTDGMPPMLLAMKHGLKYVSLMLNSGCDVTMFNDLWERGANIYHFLFSALPIGDEDHVTLCDILQHISKNKMVDINSKRESSGSSPLHELLHAVNRVPRGNANIGDIRGAYLQSYDQCVMDGITFLLEHGADIHAKDILGDSTVCTILENRNHLARCALATNPDVPNTSQISLKSSTYGVDNILTAVRILINTDTYKPSHSQYPISVFLKTLCSFDSDLEDTTWVSPFDITRLPNVMSRYTTLLELLLQHFDPNKAMDGELPPLFYLLSQATLSPDADDYMYVISVEHSRDLAAFATLLLENGASTEYGLLDTDGENVSYSCMDVLVYFLRKMQAYPHSRTSEDLVSLKQLLSVVFKYGAQPNLYNVKFYHGPDMATSENGITDVVGMDATYTFLYQYLCFGAMNLQYVNTGDVYYDVLNLIVNATNQNIVYLAFQSARLVFTCMHWPVSCECGLCHGFHAMLERYLGAPRSLRQLCRLSIRENTPKVCPRSINSICIPKPLQDYILLSTI